MVLAALSLTCGADQNPHVIFSPEFSVRSARPLYVVPLACNQLHSFASGVPLFLRLKGFFFRPLLRPLCCVLSVVLSVTLALSYRCFVFSSVYSSRLFPLACDLLAASFLCPLCVPLCSYPAEAVVCPASPGRASGTRLPQESFQRHNLPFYAETLVHQWRWRCLGEVWHGRSSSVSPECRNGWI